MIPAPGRSRRRGRERRTVEAKNDQQTAHVAEWLEAVRTRGKVSCPPEDAYRSTAAVQLAMIALKAGGRVDWDERDRAGARQPEGGGAPQARLPRPLGPPLEGRSSASRQAAAGHEVDGEGPEPVAALVVLAGHRGEALLAVDGRRGAQAGDARGRPSGSPAAIPSSIQARLRFRPSRWASFGSVGSVTTPGASQSPTSRRVGSAGQERRRASARTRPAAARAASGRPRRGRARGSPRPRARRRAGSRGRRRRSRGCATTTSASVSASPATRAQSRTRPRAKAVCVCSPMRIGWVSFGSQSQSRAAAAPARAARAPPPTRAPPGESHSRSSARELQQPGEAVRPLEAHPALALEVARPRRRRSPR